MILAQSVMARANQVYHCDDIAGGPSPAEATVYIRTHDHSHFFVEVDFKNPNYPNGIIGDYTAKYTPQNQQWAGNGTLGDVASQFNFTSHSDGTGLLVIYAGGDLGDNRVEFGFGAHLSCR